MLQATRDNHAVFWGPFILASPDCTTTQCTKCCSAMWYHLAISDEVKGRRWKWIGHVLRKDGNCYCMTALTWAPEGRRKVGSPKTMWRRTVEKERNALGWKSWGVAKPIARDRMHWRTESAALRATGPKEDRWGEVRLLSSERYILPYQLIRFFFFYFDLTLNLNRCVYLCKLPNQENKRK